MVVVDAHERDAREPRRHAGMVAPEVADADDGEPDGATGSPAAVSLDEAPLARLDEAHELLDVGLPGSSAAIRSSAWLVLSFDLTRSR